MKPRNKPDWWPKCPYPEGIFPMPLTRYEEIVPDPHLRTALSGCLGREFWNIASEAIWERFCESEVPIDIVIGKDHFTDENIRRWATGDLKDDIDFATGAESLIIEYLSHIIVEKVLNRR